MRTVMYHPSPIGMLAIEEDGMGICRVAMECPSVFRPEVCIGSTPLLECAAGQLDEYFSGQRQEFDLPLSLEGTPFQKKVWEALCAIPHGETRSYGEIARQVGSPKAGRAVGMANHNNPVIIIVPCHRVIGQDGSLTGYGSGLEVKRFLLDLERHGAKNR